MNDNENHPIRDALSLLTLTAIILTPIYFLVRFTNAMFFWILVAASCCAYLKSLNAPSTAEWLFAVSITGVSCTIAAISTIKYTFDIK